MDLQDNINRLNSFRELKHNWNDNGSEPFNDELIDKCIEILKCYDVQPYIYPTGNNSILFEAGDFGTKDYQEVEIFNDNVAIFLNMSYDKFLEYMKSEG